MRRILSHFQGTARTNRPTRPRVRPGAGLRFAELKDDVGQQVAWLTDEYQLLPEAASTEGLPELAEGLSPPVKHFRLIDCGDVHL